MKIRLLAPIKEDPSDFERMEAFIAKLFRELIYLPMVREIGVPKNILKNAMEDIIEAINMGQITYYRGRFVGKFNAAVSRELKNMGAEWNRKQGSWDIPRGQLSLFVRNAIDASEAKFAQVVGKVEKRLWQILPEEIADKPKLQQLFDATLFKTNKKISDSMRDITVAPELTAEARARLASEYTENMSLYIKTWTEEEIVELRKLMRSSATAGYRSETMIDLIQKRYDVSLNKAKFLARQETNLMMTKFKEIRYQDAGLDEYKWGCVAGSKSHPVRPMHKALEGKIFRWDTPPVTDNKGARNNPGQDYGCRCYARPLVRF